jgi:methionine synthase II (cobalamin-independent)
MQSNDIPSGVATGIGGLPHRDAQEAAEFVLRSMEMPAIPSLPRRSPAEGWIAQAMVGMQGITIGQYGSISVDPSMVDPLAPIVTDFQHDAFVGFRTFLEAAKGRTGWVKWQFVGPVTFGHALMRAGVPMSEAFESAVRCVRDRVEHMLHAVEEALPGCRQLVFIEESDFAELMNPGFPIAPDTAIDLVSGALAAIETTAVSGLHVCGLADIPSQLATGPAVLSLPVRQEVVESAGYLTRFMERGGYIAWGVVPTSGPIITTAERPWRHLSKLWCELVERGVDPALLRRQAIITPECGLSSHTPAVAERVLGIAAEVATRVRDQATASRWALGA